MDTNNTNQILKACLLLITGLVMLGFGYILFFSSMGGWALGGESPALILPSIISFTFGLYFSVHGILLTLEKRKDLFKNIFGWLLLIGGLFDVLYIVYGSFNGFFREWGRLSLLVLVPLAFVLLITGFAIKGNRKTAIVLGVVFVALLVFSFLYSSREFHQFLIFLKFLILPE